MSALQHPEQGLAHSRRFRNNPGMTDGSGRGLKSHGAAQWLTSAYEPVTAQFPVREHVGAVDPIPGAECEPAGETGASSGEPGPPHRCSDGTGAGWRGPPGPDAGPAHPGAQTVSLVRPVPELGSRRGRGITETPGKRGATAPSQAPESPFTASTTWRQRPECKTDARGSVSTSRANRNGGGGEGLTTRHRRPQSSGEGASVTDYQVSARRGPRGPRLDVVPTGKTDTARAGEDTGHLRRRLVGCQVTRPLWGPVLRVLTPEASGRGVT